MSRRWRILLVDEQEARIKTWGQYFSGLDYKIDVAATGQNAIDSVCRFRPDLILLNTMISDVNPFDICRRIKTDATSRKTIDMMVSTLNELDDIERAVEAGIDDFISMPIDKAELLRRVENLLRLGEVL